MASFFQLKNTEITPSYHKFIQYGLKYSFPKFLSDNITNQDLLDNLSSSIQLVFQEGFSHQMIGYMRFFFIYNALKIKNNETIAQVVIEDSLSFIPINNMYHQIGQIILNTKSD